MKKLLILLLVMPITCFVIWGGMNYSGFCWTEKKWLSDQERINLEIAKIFDLKKGYVPEGIDGSKEYELVPYKSVADFKQRNPECCKILNFTHNLTDVLLGNLSRKVIKINNVIDYIYNSKQYVSNPNPNPNNMEWGLYFQNNCGKEYNIFD